jgi:hypothetical protein
VLGPLQNLSQPNELRAGGGRNPTLIAIEYTEACNGQAGQNLRGSSELDTRSR